MCCCVVVLLCCTCTTTFSRRSPAEDCRADHALDQALPPRGGRGRARGRLVSAARARLRAQGGRLLAARRGRGHPRVLVCRQEDHRTRGQRIQQHVQPVTS